MSFRILLLLILFLSEAAFSACFAVQASDGRVGGTVCTQDQYSSDSWFGSFSGSRSEYGRSPVYSPPSTTQSPNIATIPFQAVPAPSYPAMEMPRVRAESARVDIPPPEPYKPMIDTQAIAAAAGAAGAVMAGIQKAMIDGASIPLRAEGDRLRNWGFGEFYRMENEINSDLSDIRANVEFIREDAKIARETKVPPVMVTEESLGILSNLKFEVHASPFSEEGVRVRKTLNRIFILSANTNSLNAIESARMSVGLTMAADLAYADKNKVAGDSLLKAAVTGFDIGMGFVPIAASVNDATQIVFGILTGMDYSGHLMSTADYGLRGIGVVIGLLPASSAVLRFGEFAFSRTTMFLSRMTRKLPVEQLAALAKMGGSLVANEIGAIGHNLQAFVKYRNLFPDSRFEMMMSALRSYNNFFTEAGRALTKHPEQLDFSNYDELRRVYRTHLEINEAAEKYVVKALLEGTPMAGRHRTLGVDTIDYRFLSGNGARFTNDGKFITFIEKQYESHF